MVCKSNVINSLGVVSAVAQTNFQKRHFLIRWLFLLLMHIRYRCFLCYLLTIIPWKPSKIEDTYPSFNVIIR